MADSMQPVDWDFAGQGFQLRTIVLLLWLNIAAPAADGNCRFPPFLLQSQFHHSVGPDASISDRSANVDAVWLTETRFERGTFHVASELEVTVRGGDTLVTKIRHPGTCSSADEDDPSSAYNVSCHQREFLYQRLCLSAMDSEKYVVEHNDGLNLHYLCMKFVPRNKNVIQVWLGPRRMSQEDDLCSDVHLQRQRWPWFASSRIEWHFCPLVGGYDVALNNSIPSRQCTGDIRSHRLESECINSEGLHLTLSTHANCSPLPDRALELRLQCWASWIEDTSLFIVLSQQHRQPQFVLRMPHVTDGLTSIPVSLFSSPICPLVGIKYPDLADINFVDMVLTPSESGICYDESPHCRRLTQNERCTKNSMYQYANVCKKSCGLCNLLPSTRPECWFSTEVLGEWLLAEVDGLRKVTITTGFLTIYGLGEFVCKSKHWNTHYYKLLSYYSNGCRPRYSCVRLERDSENTLRIQLSHSSLTDASFDVCRFADDQPPLGSRIHSSQLKILLPWAKLQGGSCGLRGAVDVSITRSTGRGTADDSISACRGRLSDWNSGSCQSRGHMHLTLGQCSSSSGGGNESVHRRDFKCVAYAPVTSEIGLLWTQLKENTDNDVTCWVVGRRSDGHTSSVNTWSELHQLNRAQCGFERDFDLANVRTIAVQSLKVIGSGSSYERRRCNITAGSSTSSPTVTSWPPTTRDEKHHKVTTPVNRTTFTSMQSFHHLPAVSSSSLSSSSVSWTLPTLDKLCWLSVVAATAGAASVSSR